MGMCKPERMPDLVHEVLETQPAFAQRGVAQLGPAVFPGRNLVAAGRLQRRIMRPRHPDSEIRALDLDQIGVGGAGDEVEVDIGDRGPLVQGIPECQFFCGRRARRAPHAEMNIDKRWVRWSPDALPFPGAVKRRVNNRLPFQSPLNARADIAMARSVAWAADTISASSRRHRCE